MNNFIEHVHNFTTQDDADDVFTVPLPVHLGPLELIEVDVYLAAVAGSPTAVTLDIDITDGTTTNNVIAAGSIGTSAGQTRLTPDADSTPYVEADTDDNWRYEVDFNFTGGTSPTVTGSVVLRFAI